MAPLSLKIILDEGAITRTLMFDTTTIVREAHHIVRDKILTLDLNKEYGFFLASADNECSGVWLDDGDKTLEYYMLRDGDSLHYLLKIRNLRLRMLDGAVKTLQLDESKKVIELMVYICEKLRISHSEEYGLCREEPETAEDSRIGTGTLTLKKKTIQREKDPKLEQLSKKLKTDDLVEWLDQHKTLRELKVDPQEMLLFKRRLFYSDRNVDSRDPVQLNLLYVQTRDGILEGKQVVTETKALEFAGLQCQIQFGNYQEDKHKPGFIQNLKEFLPEQYVSWGIEKKTIKEHKKHVGVPEIEAKHLYTKMARELPTYGVTFFLVKEKQLRKKKLVPRLLGINAQSILRLDEETKEIIQVWLLTQVKSYRADYESFALNFGDYSEKEYVVKTNEGFRIKDILEGYIDIIRRSLAAPRKINFTEGEAMYEDNVERLRGTTIQNYAPSKMIQSSLVGPSKVISVDQGQQARECTQILTINELIKTNLENNRQNPLINHKAELQFNKGQSTNGFENTMKNFNSKCVTTVLYLSDPNEQNIEKVQRTVACLKDALPEITHGVKETAANSSPLKSKILLNNLDDLCSYINNLSNETIKNDLSKEENLIQAQDTAKKAADLSTQMHLSLDPNTKRRSKILMRSRDSFIQDEKTEASLRRASFLAATDNAWTAVENAAHLLDEDNENILSYDECKQLGKKVPYDLGKLQATIAMILNSHADPANIDYEGAVMSMKTLSEIMPLLIQDIKHLITVVDKETGEDLKKYVRQLLDCTRAMCMLTGSDNVNKMFDVGNDYADVCKKITENIMKYNNQSTDNLDYQNDEIVKQVQNVGSKVQILLMGTSELTKLEALDPRATELDTAAIKCTDATECLIACARLTLSSIHEPHSKSALTAATENITSTVQNMALLWKILSEKPNRKSFAKQLANSTFELTKTLDKLRNEFSNIHDIDEGTQESKSNKQRLKFISKLRSSDKIIGEAGLQLQNMSNLTFIPIPKTEDRKEHPEVRNNLSLKLAHLNAAVAALVQTNGDTYDSDYTKAEMAVDIISKLLPDIIKDSKYLNGQVDETTWKNILEYLKDMLEATRDICENANESNEESRNVAESKYVNASRRLTYIYNPRKKCEKENEIMDLSKSVVDEISQMLTQVHDLIEIVGREDGDLLDNTGVKVVPAAQRLLKIAEVLTNIQFNREALKEVQSTALLRSTLVVKLVEENGYLFNYNKLITSPNINEVRCQESLLSAIDHVYHEIENLKSTWTPILQSPEYKEYENQLNNNFDVVNKRLNTLRETATESDDSEKSEQKERLNAMSGAFSIFEKASRQLQEMTDSRLLDGGESSNEHLESRNNLSQKLAHLNAAIAALLQATKDPNNCNYKEAKIAVDFASQLTQEIIKDSQHLNGKVDETTWNNITEYLRDMLEATRDICENADESNRELFNGAISQFANASRRLTYIYNRRKKCEKEDQIKDLSKSAVGEISEMLTRAHDFVKNMGKDDKDFLKKTHVKIEASAQRLQEIAEITAPNINEVRCQESLLSAIDDVSHEIENLKSTWTPILQSPECKEYENQLNNNFDVVNTTLNALRETCTESAENQKKQKNSDLISTTDSDLDDTSKQLPERTALRMINLAKTAADEISRLLPKMTAVLNDTDGEQFGQLQKLGNAFERTVNQLHRTAELTAPSINNSQSQNLLVSAINDVSTKQKLFMETWKPFLLDPKYIHIEKELQDSIRIVEMSKLEIAKAINELLPEAESRGYKQPDQLQATVCSLKKALFILNNDLEDMSRKRPETTVDDISSTKKLLAQKLCQLNAALASILISSTEPDVRHKTSSIEIFSKLLSDILKNAKHLHGSTDTQTWNITSENLKTIINASEVIYNNIQDNPKNVDSAVTIVANSAAVLRAMYNQRTNLNKENQIQQLSRLAVEQISLLLPHVYHLAKAVGGSEGTELDQVGVTVVEGAKQLLKTAQMTASTADDPDCQEVLLSSVNNLKELDQKLRNTWEPYVESPKNHEIKSQLEHKHDVINATLEKIRNTCLGDSENLEIQEKLHNLNIWKAKEKIKEAERLFYEEKDAPVDINKAEKSTGKPVFEQRAQLTQKIAQLNKAMALLLQGMLDRRNPDYETIKESIDVISNLTPDVIKESLALQVKLDDDSRQLLFSETKSLCKANQEICSSVENNSLEELLQEATKYAQASGKILHVTRLDNYPNKERKILELSRNACERTSLLLSRLSRLAGLTDRTKEYGEQANGEGVRDERAYELEAVGITVADAAHALLTNAQITAPSINEENCQAVLLSSVEKLSDLTQTLKNLCIPITHYSDAQDIEGQLQRDLTLLYKDIEDLKTACHSESDSFHLHHQTQYNLLPEEIKLESRSQMESDHLVQVICPIVRSQENNEDKLIIEDTPLRQLALKILESIKTKVKSNSLPQNEQKEFEKFSQDLSAAINTLDLCNSRCINKPRDSRRLQDLELAVMDLQQTCLLSKRTDSHNNVVDLTDYVDDVIGVVRNLSKTADDVLLKSTDERNETLEELKNKCKKIQENENQLQNRVSLDSDGESIIDNMMRIDQFAKDCADTIQEMSSLIVKINSESAKNVLQEKLQCLTESCDLLRFAAKSSISSAASVEFDENIQNLEIFENKIENILKTNEEFQNLQVNKKSFNPSPHIIQSAQIKVTEAILSRNKNNLPKELTRYAVTMQNEMTSRDDQIRYKLEDHLQSLLDLLKLQTTAKSRRIANWQEAENDDSIMNESILEELKAFSSNINHENAEIKTPMNNLIQDSDIRSMLFSNKLPVEGNIEELKHKLSEQIQKMSSVAQTIVLTFDKPEMLSRSLHMTLDAAEELTAISKGLKGKDLLQNKRIDGAVQEIKMVTYTLIKTAEALSQVPVPDSHRKLQEICKSLHEALNKIGRTTCPDSPEYCELQRDLKLATQLTAQYAPPTAPLGHCMEQMQSQLELINILRSSEDMTKNCRSQLRQITSAVCSGSELGAQCACLLSLSDEDKHIAQHGDIDRYRISKTTDSIQDTCLQIVCSGNDEQAKELESVLNKQINQLQESLDDNSSKVNKHQVKELLDQGKVINIQFKELQEALNSTTFREKEVTPRTFKLMDAIKKLNVQIERIPRARINDSLKNQETAKEVVENIKKLINNTSTMIKKASCCEENSITWENIGGKDVIQAFETLISFVRRKGTEAGIMESEESDIIAKSFLQTQIDLTNTWLTKPASKEDKVIGVKAVESILELAEKMCEDLGGGEKEELKHVIIEAKQLLSDCASKYNSEKASCLRERLQDARKLCERGAVTRAVEAFLHEPHHDVEELAHEPDEKKRKFLLEKKIAELLAHLARVTKTARFVADTGVAPRQALVDTTEQVQLLAPALVKAAERRITHLDDQVAVENYQKLLASYAESLTKIRELCDSSVDPIDFSRAAGETIHRIKEESGGDLQKSVHTSRVIIKLGHRVVEAGLRAPLAKKDPELQRTLADIKTALGRHEHMQDVAAEILKKTGEVESALGGETIFQKEPDSDQPIYTAALQLHASLRGWSARHNEAVDGAKLLAVLMARLSHYMDTDNKRELIITSKAIVDKSREIANIARKLALECTDMRIRTNLLQVCERIPTISGQLKMLTTVKSSSLGQQGSAEDKEAMNMLVGNAQNLMISIQEVVKAAESASVKIMSSQRGYRMKWVQRNYY